MDPQLSQQQQSSASTSPTDVASQPHPTRPISPISQLLETLGMTREDLSKRSAQMRDFLTAESSFSTSTFNEFATVSYTKANVSDNNFGIGSYCKTDTTSTSMLRTFPGLQRSTTNISTAVATAPSRQTETAESQPSLSRACSNSSTLSTSVSTSLSNASNASSASSPHTISRKDSSRHISSRDKQSHYSRHSRRSSGSSHVVSPTRSKPSLDEIMQIRARESASRRSRTSRPDPDTSDDSSDETMDCNVFSSTSRRVTSKNDDKSSISPFYQSDTDWNYFYRGPRTVAQSAAHYRKDHYPKAAASSPYYRSADRPTMQSTTKDVAAEEIIAEEIAAKETSEQIPAEAANTPAPQVNSRHEEDIAEVRTEKPSSASYYRKNYDKTPSMVSSSPISVHSVSSDTHRRSESKTSEFSSPSKSSSFSDDFDVRDPEQLPYTLPPGPYNEEKPDLSYAAMIGRAILASPNHRLKLKDIYDYISTVFPYYKRPPPGAGGSHAQKWMNAIRQNLTNTIQFRKIGLKNGEYDTSKDTAKGGWWAILDEDLWCFKDGGYSRRNSELVGAKVEAEMDNEIAAVDGEMKTEKRKRKEGKEEASASSSQPTKKRNRKTHISSSSIASSSLLVPSLPNPYHFPYNNSGHFIQVPPSCAGFGPSPFYFSTQPGMVFPYVPGQQTPHDYPLLSQADYLANVNAYLALDSQASSNDGDISEALSTLTSPIVDNPAYIEGLDYLYGSQNQSPTDSLPELTPNGSSDPAEVEVHEDVFRVPNKRADHASGVMAKRSSTTEDSKGKGRADELPSSMVISDDMGISPRRVFGGYSPAAATVEALEPSVDIFGKEDAKYKGKKKGKKAQSNDVSLSVHPFPVSPTMQRRASKKDKEPDMLFKLSAPADFVSSSARPSTPPRNPTTHPLSSVRTPIRAASRGPEPTKATLHAVPMMAFGEHLDSENVSILRTPSRARTISENSSLQQPVTPSRKLYASPFPSLLGVGFSPFRTPSRRPIFDPHDPGTLLEEEIAQMRSLEMLESLGSPLASFAEKGLLYESPSLPSPSAWTRPW